MIKFEQRRDQGQNQGLWELSW